MCHVLATKSTLGRLMLLESTANISDELLTDHLSDKMRGSC